MEIITKPFDSYKVTYSITNPDGKNYARIDFFAAEAKVVLGDRHSRASPDFWVTVNYSKLDRQTIVLI